MRDPRIDRSGAPTLSLALHSVLDAAVEASARAGLLSIVRTEADEAGGEGAEARVEDRIVVPFPGPRRPTDDGPHAA